MNTVKYTQLGVGLQATNMWAVLTEFVLFLSFTTVLFSAILIAIALLDLDLVIWTWIFRALAEALHLGGSGGIDKPCEWGFQPKQTPNPTPGNSFTNKR